MPRGRIGNLNPAQRNWLIIFLLIAGTLAVYWRAATFDFVTIDDWAYVTDNSHVKAGLSWDGIVWAFRTTLAGNWHPLTILSHMLDCDLFGARPAGHHLANVVLHVANTVLLFVVLKGMTGAPWRSAFVAALFSIHPLHVESVAWISERKDLLCGFFFLLTVWAYGRYARRKFETRNSKLETNSKSEIRKHQEEGIEPQRHRDTERARENPVSIIQYLASGHAHFPSLIFYFLALVFFALGLMSKPMIVTLPFVLLLVDYWPLRRFDNATVPSLIVEKVPFFLLAAAGSFVAFLAQKGASATVSLQKFPFEARLANAAVSYARYLGKSCWPESLSILYPYPGGWAAWQIIGATALVLILSAAAILLARRQRYIFVGWFWFVGMLVPVIGLVQVGTQSMADRYTYVPLIGLFIAVTWCVADWLASRAPRAALAAGMALMIMAFSVVTSHQLRYWKNSEVLYEQTIRVSHNNAQAHYCLGAILDWQSRTNEAATHYLEAIRIMPDFPHPHCGMAGILQREGKLDQATKECRLALKFQPSFPEARYRMAEILARQNQTHEAVTNYLLALKFKHDYPEAHYQLAVLLSSAKRAGEAVIHYREAVRLKPDWLEALNNLAWTLATDRDDGVRNGGDAVRFAMRAVELTQGQNPGALDTLAAAYAESGKFTEARSAAEKAVTFANRRGEAIMAAEIQKHLECYNAGHPFRE